MKPLSSYVRFPMIDGHRHVFSHRGINTMTFGDGCIGFMDIEYDCLDQYKDIPAMYNSYIRDYIKGTKDLAQRRTKLLATALTIDDIKKIYNDHLDTIVGFGELKLYDNFKGKDLKFKRISFARDVCKFSQQVGCLPVYIHYELTEDKEVKAFDKLLTDFPDVPIVLCHLGMNEHNQQYAWGAAKKLAWEHGNCWLDISWDAAHWLATNPMLITQLPVDRIFWGSDTSPRLKAHGFISASFDEIYGWRNSFMSYLDSDKNIKRLFHEES